MMRLDNEPGAESRPLHGGRGLKLSEMRDLLKRMVAPFTGGAD